MKIYTNYNFLGNAIENAVMYPVSALPAGKAGLVCYLNAKDGDNEPGLYYFGSAWERVATTGELAAVIAAFNDHATSNEEKFAAIDETIKNIQENAYDDTALRGLISAVQEKAGSNETAINGINETIATLATKSALESVKATADAAAVKTEVDAALATKATASALSEGLATKVSNEEFNSYKTTHAEELAGVKATADAAATKSYTDTELAKKANTSDVTVELGKKVDKVDGKSLILDSEIERLATLHNYDDTTVKADIAKKADAEAMTTALGGKVDKVEGKSLVDNAEIERLAGINNYDDTAVKGRLDAVEAAAKTHATKTEVSEAESRATAAAGTAENNAKSYADGLKTTIEENAANTYHTTEAFNMFLTGYNNHVTDYGLLKSRFDDVEADYLKGADKTELEGKIQANASAIELLTNGVSADEVDGVNDLIQYVKDHGSDVEAMNNSINANTKAISDEATVRAEADAAIKTAVNGSGAVKVTNATATITSEVPAVLPLDAFEIKVWDASGEECIVGTKKTADGIVLSATGLEAGSLSVTYKTFATITIA